MCRRRMGKDLDASAKEMARQEQRIKQYEIDPERDEYDVKKQVDSLRAARAARPHAHARALPTRRQRCSRNTSREGKTSSAG